MSDKKMVEYNGQMVEAIDCTPSWTWAAQLYIAALENGSPEGKQNAKEGIMEMAQKFDEATKRISDLRKKADDLLMAYDKALGLKK